MWHFKTAFVLIKILQNEDGTTFRFYVRLFGDIDGLTFFDWCEQGVLNGLHIVNVVWGEDTRRTLK